MGSSPLAQTTIQYLLYKAEISKRVASRVLGKVTLRSWFAAHHCLQHRVLIEALAYLIEQQCVSTCVNNDWVSEEGWGQTNLCREVKIELIKVTKNLISILCLVFYLQRPHLEDFVLRTLSFLQPEDSVSLCIAWITKSRLWKEDRRYWAKLSLSYSYPVYLDSLL